MPLIMDSPPPMSGPPCAVCRTQAKTWICAQCSGYTFCVNCWTSQLPHRPDAPVVPGCDPHEKVNHEVFNRQKRVFNQSLTHEDQEKLHDADIDTTWFGVVKEGKQPRLRHHNRLIDIMRESQTGQYDDRFPHLVSFVGQTGAGKSTVIRLLIEHAQAHTETQPRYRPGIFPVPVTGLVNDNIPTTGDVHLYSDPATYSSEFPVLYADCEGLSGGEKTPLAVKYKEKRELERIKSKTHTSLPARVRKSFPKTKLLAWADKPETQTREFCVKELYPRVLYTFSDVIVFVLREVKTFQSKVLPNLVQWAYSSIDQSVNQPTLPHIVIVINATDGSIDEKQWDPKVATEKLLDDYKDSIQEVTKLQNIVASLGSIGRKISSTRQLLEFYYASITVVRIPTKGRYQLIEDQVGKLHHQIQQKCDQSSAHKRSARMLLNAEMMQQYVNSAYDHFSRRLDEPFDFIKEALRHTPIPKDFGGHILNLILAIYQDGLAYDTNNVLPSDMLLSLSRPIACCVMLAAAREHMHGTYKTLLHHVFYKPLHETFDEFQNKWLRCAFISTEGNVTCCNAKNSHEKGHQARSGKIIERGPYLSPFSRTVEFTFDIWMQRIEAELDNLRKHLNTYAADAPERALVSRLHREESRTFYRDWFGPAFRPDFSNYSTCFACVRNIPKNILPCGHALCKACIQSFGSTQDGSVYELEQCPLNPMNEYWADQPARIRFKPKGAGIRVLSLDGGGVRGIVELTILEAIEKELEGLIPVQEFFDLIVGTSTGGIIALGLGVAKWPVATCIDKFLQLSTQAFTSRPLKFMAAFSHKSYYKATPFEEALRVEFGEDRALFGGSVRAHEERSDIKVAVTSTSAAENKPVIMTNYNTAGAEREECPYRFLSPQRSGTEMKVWEAARATSAAPLYFKSYTKPETGIAYTDGAIHYNCPVWVAHHERQFLWPEVRGWSPDIVLSLGTGQSSKPTTPEKEELKAQEIHNERRKSHGIRYMWRTAYSILDSQINCEKAWRDYCSKSWSHIGYSSGEREKRRGHSAWQELQRRRMRIDVQFPAERPTLDDVKKLKDIRRQALISVETNTDIKEIAHRLIASSFYFELERGFPFEGEMGQFISRGTIRCRFETGSSNIKGLGELLKNFVKGDFKPYFLLQENYGAEQFVSVWEPSYFPIELPTINEMREKGKFETEVIKVRSATKYSITRISLRLREANYPGLSDPHLSISGFPRELLAQSTVKSLPVSPHEEHVSHAPRRSTGGNSTGSIGTLNLEGGLKRLGSWFSWNTATTIVGGARGDHASEKRASSDNDIGEEMKSAMLSSRAESRPHSRTEMTPTISNSADEFYGRERSRRHSFEG